MPAKSKSQQSAFGMALAARKGKIKPEELRGSAKILFKDNTLSNNDLEDYASTKRSELPIKTFGQQHRTYKRG